MGLCSGHGNSVAIRELSFYPQSLLAKLTVVVMFNESTLLYVTITITPQKEEPYNGVLLRDHYPREYGTLGWFVSKCY